MIRIASKEANKSEFPRAKIGAVIANKGRVLSVGYNQVRGYRKCPTTRVWENSMHAEQDAILKMLNQGRQHELAGSTLFVSRIMKDDTTAMAKPCKCCQELIRAVGIKKVSYTTKTGVESYAPGKSK